MKKDNAIDLLLNKLEKFSSKEDVINIYAEEQQRENLKKYLSYYSYNKPSYLLVGEAPGRDGCGKTGIPFVDDHTIKNNPFLRDTIGLVFSGEQSERTSQIVWNAFGKEIQERGVMFWNIFPFHPVKDKETKANRTPRRNEIQETEHIWNGLLELIEVPKEKIYCIGVTSNHIKFGKERSNYLRHPSFAGKTAFEEMFKSKILGEL